MLWFDWVLIIQRYIFTTIVVYITDLNSILAVHNKQMLDKQQLYPAYMLRQGIVSKAKEMRGFGLVREGHLQMVDLCFPYTSG